MDQVLQQLGGLLLGSVPTIAFMVVLFWLYTVLLHKPLARTLAERRSRTEGAMEKARADVAAADARTAEYEQRLREARMAIFQSQEARRQNALQARTAAAAEARAKAQAQVEEVRAAIAQDLKSAQSSLQAQSGKLAAEIIRIVLTPAGGS